jgi:hypothetical protein
LNVTLKRMEGRPAGTVPIVDGRKRRPWLQHR